MSLSPEEYREHLATTAVRAGFSFGEVVLPQSHEFRLGRMRFHYLDWGNKHLPTIVFLHGGALTAHTWDLVSLALRDEYHCVALIEKALEFNPRRDPKILRRSLMHNLRQQPDGTWKWKYDTQRFKALDQEVHRAERAKLADGLQRIACPTLIVRGGESDVFHEEDGIRLAQRLPDGKFVTVPRAGHTVQGDNPKDLVAELRRFLAGDN